MPRGTISDMKRMGRRTFIPIFVAIGAILIGAGVYVAFLLVTKQPDSSTTKPIEPVPLSNVCTDDMVRRVGQPIADSDIIVIRSVYDEFKTNPNYKGDATCNYIATRYFIATGNIEEAQIHLNALKYAISAGGIVSMNFTPPAQPTDEVEAMLETLKLIKQGSTQGISADELNRMDEMAPQ